MSTGKMQLINDLLARAGLSGGKGTVAKAAVVVVGIAVLVSIVIGRGAPGAEFVSTEDVTTVTTTSAEGDVVTVGRVVVHVAGAVLDPGVYTLDEGARVDDAIGEAGGPLGNAAIDALNLARILVDGEQVYVQTQDQVDSGGVGLSAGGGGGVSSATGLVNLNSASVTDLDALPGIGPSTAQKIVDDRDSNGPFATIDDLMRVSGIGAKKVDSLRDLVTVK